MSPSPTPSHPDSTTAIVQSSAAELTANLDEARRATRDWATPNVDEHVHAALDGCLRQLDQTGLRGADNRIASSILWKLAGDYLSQGPLQLRARDKPRGYAGDFEMLRMICDNECCREPLGASFDHYFQAQAAPQAVRNRTRLVAEQIESGVRSQGDFHVVSLGSGPGIDIEQAARRLGAAAAALRVTLLDIDPAALEHAERRLSQFDDLPPVRLERVNLGRVAKNRQLLESLSGADLISCTGLMDYFAAREVADNARALRECLSDSGKLLLFNFSTDNPSRLYMEWIGNWYLQYRSRDDLLEIGARAGFDPDRITVGSDETGVSLHLTAFK